MTGGRGGDTGAASPRRRGRMTKVPRPSTVPRPSAAGGATFPAGWVGAAGGDAGGGTGAAEGDVVAWWPVPQGGMLAVRENRYIVLAKDFEKAYKTVIKKDEQEHEFYK